MADDIQQPVGALAAASGQAVPEKDVFQVDYEQSRQALRNQQARLDQRREQLMAAMEGRKNRLFDPSLMRLAQGLLAPTKTGSFGESLGYGVGAMADEQEREFARQAQDARLMYELEQSSAQQKKEEMLQNREEMEYRRQQKIRELSGNLVDFKTDEKTGAVTYNVNPMIAQQLTKLTGDMKYADKLIADFQTKAEQKVASSMFEERRIPATDTEPEKVVFKFNPQSVINMAKVSANPIETIAKYAKMIPDLRKSGLIEGISDNGTPFDAIATMIPDPAIKAQAERLAKQYKEGRLDEDKANTLAQQMLSMATSHMDKQAQRELTQAIAGLNAGMRQQGLAMQREGLELRKENIDRQRAEDAKKLTDEQKATYNKVIIPILNQGSKAVEAMNETDFIRTKVLSAPSGLLRGIRAATWGALMGTDENTAQREIESWSKKMITLIPRLPGSASNLDAQNLEKSLGNLADKKLTTEQRMKLLDDIYAGFERLSNRAYDIQNYWDTNKKMMPIEGKKPAGSEASAAPAAPAPRKFTVIRD